MSYRPLTDTWILARPKVKYYGAYPAGFPERARAFLGVTMDDAVLHVCSGKVRDYPYSRAVGPNDQTLDLDPALQPDYLQDAREPLPGYFLDSDLEIELGWPAILIDRPYTPDDADHYAPGREALPSASLLVRNALAAVRPGGRVGILDYEVPRPPKDAKLVAIVGVIMGFGNNIRAYTVFERPWTRVKAAEERKAA